MTPSLSHMVTDGANRVGERSPVAPSAPFVFLAAVMVTALILRRGSRFAHGMGVAAIVCAAVPGWSTFAAQRPSSPLQGTTAAAVVERFRGQVQAFAEEHRREHTTQQMP